MEMIFLTHTENSKGLLIHGYINVEHRLNNVPYRRSYLFFNTMKNKHQTSFIQLKKKNPHFPKVDKIVF